MSLSKVEAKINGQIYGGWKECDVRRSLKSLSGSFDLAITDRWSAHQKSWPIKRGDEAQILVNGEPVVTGFVDMVKLSVSATDKSIAISGRDKTCDMVDSSVDLNKSQFINISLPTIATQIAKQFGIKVIAQVAALGVIEVASLQTGESAFEFLEKLARKKGVLLTTDGLGNLLITRPGHDRATTALVLGQNLLTIDRIDDGIDRFSVYKVKGQGLGAQIQNQTNPDQDFFVMGTAKDAGVLRYRPKIMLCETGATTKEAMTRAQWEAKSRAAKGEPVSATVQGWVQSDGKLWQPNQIVKVVAPWLNLNEERLISEVSYHLSSSSGSIATLSLDRKDAFIPEPVTNEDPGLGGRIRQDRQGG